MTTWRPATWTTGGRDEDITCRTDDEAIYSRKHDCMIGKRALESAMTTNRQVESDGPSTADCTSAR